MRTLGLALALIVLPLRAYAAYPDLESWADPAPSPWTLYCSETMDGPSSQGASGFLNPNASTSKQCGTGSSSGGTITDSGTAMFWTTTAAGKWLPSTATITRLLVADQVPNTSAARVDIFPAGYTFSPTTGRWATRHYSTFTSDSTPISAGHAGSESRKFIEMQIAPTAQWGNPNQAQGADNKDGAGTIHLFYSGAAGGCGDLGGITRIGGEAMQLADCSDPYWCRWEQAFTWNGTTATFEYRVTQISSDGTDSAVYDERRESCTPGTAPTGFSNGAWINAFTEGDDGGQSGERYIALAVGAYTSDTTLGRWIGPASEMQGGLSPPGQPAFMPWRVAP